MTVVAVWYEPKDQCAWIVADTRISGTGGGTLTDSAAKVLALPITCFHPSKTGFFDNRSYSSSIGFAYAGSTLAALMTYAAASNCLQNLNGLSDTAPPDLIEIAKLVARIAVKYIREVGSDCEFILAGWCPKQKRLRAFTLRPSEAPRVIHIVEETLYSERHFQLIGSHTQEIRQAIMDAYEAPDGPSLRVPQHILKQLIENGRFPKIGGSLQIGIADQSGFSTKWWATNQITYQDDATFGRFLLGIDLDAEIGMIGSYIVGGTGTI